MTALTAREITHYYRMSGKRAPLHVLDEISLRVEPNSFVSIIGSSGCGKSTLLKIFAGLIEPVQGDVFVNGRPVRGPDTQRGMVFQQDAIFPWMTVLDNIAYGMRCRRVDKRIRQDIAREWAERVGLKGFEEAMPRELSGGMRKRVDVARVYANDPDILLMDEPFGSLDAQTKERMQSELLSLWESNRKTVVFITHDLDEAIFLSDVIVVMGANPGRLTEVRQVDLPRPRNAEVRLGDDFLATKRQLYRQIDQQ